MADKNTSLFDAEIRSVLLAERANREARKLQEDIAARQALDPNYGQDFASSSTPQDQAFYEASSHLGDLQSQQGGRTVGEHLQDALAGLMGTIGTIDNTVLLAGSALLDGRERIADGQSDWRNVKDSLERMNSTSEYWNSLQSEKSAAFDRITQYRQDRAIEQLGADASLYDRLTTGFGAAAGSYLDNPGQIVTDGVAQLPYLITGGLAKGLTTGTAAIRTGVIGVTAKETTSRLAAPLINQMVARGMTAESAKKLVQMGLSGVMQGTIEGADAASSTYTRVMDSTDTFGPGQEAEKESAALAAAAKAFVMAGPVSAITGTLASKFELSPFTAKGTSALARTGDNLIKGLQEGVQETIESGNSQFAANYAGNTVLKGKDLVALDQGVGGAAGQGFVVGMGSTAVTNPRSAIDAGLVPIALAGKGFNYIGSKAKAKERAGDMEAAQTNADEVIANITTPAAMAAVLKKGVQQPVDPETELDSLKTRYESLSRDIIGKYGKDHFNNEELTGDPEYSEKIMELSQMLDDRDDLTKKIKAGNQSVDTPIEEIELPPEMQPRATDGPIGQAVRTFATGMQYLRGKDMNSDDAVTAFHVLGAVLESANNIRSLRDGAAADAVDQNLTEEQRDSAQKALTGLKGLLDTDQLDKWVADFPMEDIESELEDLKKTPEAFGSVIAHLAAMNPLKMTNKLIDTALESKSLPKAQRDSLLLAQELKAAEADLKVSGKPNSEEVTRSMMQTGFPGYRENDSVAGYIRRVTQALAENDTETAQIEFHRLVKFSNFEQGRAAAYEAAKAQMAADPDSKRIELDGYYQINDMGKLDKTMPQFVDKKALELVKIVRKDADAIAKMVAALQKRTGLDVVTPAAKAPTKPAEPKAEKPAPKAPAETKKPATAPESPKVAPKPVVSRITPEQAQRLSQKGLEDRITAISVKGEEQTAEDKATFLILADERTRREAELPAETEEDVVEIDEPGREVATGTGTIQLNAGQAAAYDKVLGFLRNTAARTFSIIGSAGTGKTTLINAVLAEVRKDPSLKNKNIILTSPTHRANAVIRSKNPGEKILTLHKLLGLKPTVDIENFDAKKLEFEVEDSDNGLGEDTVIIIDESSMINDGLFKYLQQTLSANPGLQIIFMGDAAQLGPVKQNTDSKALTGTEDRAELTKVMRAKNAALLDESIHVRQEGDFSNKKNMDKGQGVNFTNTVSGFIQHAVKFYQSDAFVKNPLLLRVVAATNQAVTDFNKAIRSSLFGSDDAPLQKGELLMGYASFGRANANGTTAISNGVDYIIQSVGRPATVRVLGVPMQVSNATIKDVFGGPATTVPIILPGNTPEAFAALEVALQDLLDRARKDRRLWKEFYAFKDMYVILQDLRNPDNRSRTLVSKTMDYGYAHTIHKSQGGTYRYVFVDEASIQKFPSQKDQERLRYVGLTRAEEGAFVYTTGAITQGEAKKASASVVQTPKVKAGAAPVSNESRITPEQAQQLSFKGLQARIDAITKKGIQSTTKEDDSTLAVLNEELDRRAEEALRRDEDNENPEPSDIDDNFEEPTAAEAVAEVGSEPSKNHYTDLMPSYPVAEGASVAEQNVAKNHLTQSFTKSDKPGLLSKLPKTLGELLDQLGVVGKDVDVATKVAGLKTGIKARLQEKIQAAYRLKLNTLKTMPLWKNANAHSLYATTWNDKTIAYDPVIADVMAWTGVQHLMDLAYPMSWSEDKKQAMMKTYGPKILALLAEGWVPLQDQVKQVANKLQTNLELKADKNVSLKYTEGTMLALAMDTLGVMFQEEGYDGPLRVQQVENMKGAKINWINVSTADRNLLLDSARVMENFFPERASTNAAIIGKPPTNVNPFYRGSKQKISKEQREALLQRGNDAHKLSPLLLNLWNALPNEAGLRLLGWKAVPDKPVTYAEIAQNGANLTLESDLRVISNHVTKVKEHASQQEGGMEVTDVPSFFEYEQVVNGRAMTKGISPQSSKWYRELFSTVQRVVDPKNPNTRFRMAVAQGLGSKMDKRQISESLKWLEDTLAKPAVQRALQAAYRFGHGDVSMLEEDLVAFEESGIEITPHAISALVHWAEHEASLKAGTTFTSSLSYEIDGLTDGPINLMMLMGLKGGAKAMESWLALGGLFFGPEKISVQDKINEIKDMFQGSRDMYEIIASKATAANEARRNKILASVKASQRKDTDGLMRAIDHLMLVTKLAERNDKGEYKHTRAFTKKPTQASGYLQGEVSIVNDLANSMLGALSELMDAGELSERDKQALNVLLGRRLAYSDKDKQFYVEDLKDGYSAMGWEGEPLTYKEFRALTGTLSMYGGYGLVSGTFEVIGSQRAHLSSATNLINAQIGYAQKVLAEKYADKQAEQVAAGNLHEKDALSKKDEEALVAEVWESLIPHPMLRNTGGLPTSSTSRSGVSKNNVEPVQGALFGNRLLGKHVQDQNLWLSEAAFEDPGVSFAALSIMASGDGSMMTGFKGNNKITALDMYDGIYIDPEDIDLVGDLINKEVKANWQHDYIGSILKSLKLTPEFQAWAETQPAKDKAAAAAGMTLWNEVKEAEASLVAQQKRQTSVMADINSRDHSVSHMAGHNNAHLVKGIPLNSTTLGTSVTDPLLDLAADDLGESINGIRKMSAADIKSLLNNHTFENPLLKGLWNVLAPLLSDNIVLYMSSDKQGMADFYQQNERREMGIDVNGISIGDRVYVRTINAETIVHELLHATTKNLTATFFANPASLTDQQRAAMADLKVLANEFVEIDPETLPVSQAPMVAHVQAIMRGYVAKGDLNSAMQEFLAYSLTNYQVQRTLGNTKSRLGELLDSVFAAIKKMFGFPNGNKSDSMLAHLLSNFEALTEEAVDMVYTTSVEAALESTNPSLARSFGEVLDRLEKRSATVAKSLGARVDGVTRMQELAKTGLFPTMTSDQLAAGAYLQAMFAVGLQMKAADNALLARVVDAVRDEGPKAFGTDPVQAKARYDFFFENNSNKHDRVADILSLGLVNPEFAGYMEKIVLPKQQIDKRGFNNWLDSLAKSVYELMDTGLILKGNATLGDALEVATLRIRQSMLQSIKRQEAKPGAYRKLTDKLSEGVHLIGEKVGKEADARLQANQTWIGTGLMLVAGMANTSYADRVGKLVLSYSNHMDGMNPAREVVQELVGTNSDNFKLIQLMGIAARMISAIRQNFREQTPVTVKSWFKDLSPEQDALLHTVIGKFATYSLSQNLKDRMEELLTDPSSAKLDAELVLMSGGNRTKRLLMIKYAKQLGDRMANQGTEALYLNTRAIAGLSEHGGGDVLTDAEMAALENLSTLQALSHLTPTQRRQTLALYRDNTEGFWKATALIDSFFQFDTQRAGKNTATLNMQKGWIPVEADGRKKLKLFQKSEVRKAERMGWVQVGEFKDDPNLVYMATTVGKTPTLSGGAIHAVDFHMNGIHYHSGMPTDPSIQTLITHPKAMADIQRRILNGEVMPYTALYNAADDLVGFQRLLDPAMVELHTKTVGRLSDAAGIWLGRLHEERVAHGQNQVAADLLAKTWEEGKKDKREKEFVNIRQPINLKDPNAKQDKVLLNVWETLPYHTKVQLETVFADGSKNPPIWIRRDQLNDAIGYHKASVGNFFTGDNRYEKSTNDNVAALSRQMLGKNAYKYLLTAEEGWQALIGSAKDTIIVKSLVVMLNNLTSNQIQLFMITGNPIWNLRVQSQKHKELVSYLGYQQRIARLKAEELSTADPKAIARVNAEQTFLKNEMRKLSIYPLIEAGEMPTIAEGLSETEEFSLVGDFTAWAEKQMGKMPPAVSTVINNLAVSKETSLYKGLDRGVQYGDFVAKATMYEWLTTQDKAAKTEALELMKNDKTLKWADAIHTIALKEINDEFVNYARLPGRWRTYGEDMGLLWFYNYKIRIMKMAFRRMRKNPAAFLIGAQLGSVLGVETLVDSMPQNVNFAYSTGLDPLFSAHETILWNQMF